MYMQRWLHVGSWAAVIFCNVDKVETKFNAVYIYSFDEFIFKHNTCMTIIFVIG